jgi:hypothetical protein
MALLSSFNEDRPVSYFRGYPIYYATIITIAYGLGVILTALMGGMGLSPEEYVFYPARSIAEGQLWQILTYSFISPPNFFTIFGLIFIYIAAVETEKYIGKNRFLTLYAIVLLLPVLFLSGWYFVTGQSVPTYGNYMVSIGFFIAFCTLYPGIQWFGLIALKWIAWASVVLGSLMYFSQQQWPQLIMFWLVCGGSFGFIRLLQRGFEFPQIRNPFRRRVRPRLRVVSKPVAPVRERRESPSIDVDQLLDKISKHGLSSLTAEERATLERARAKLLEKERGGGR